MIRFFDILFSFFAIIAFLPIFIPVGVLLFCTGEHKVFYRQNRVGFKGVSFSLLKFATMLENSPNLPGGDITMGDDPRVLPVGKFLRKSKINELPQIFNILLGDMSFVGPRPLTPKNFNYYNKESQQTIITVKPGLTGIGSLVFRDEESIIQNSSKISIDCYKEDISPYKAVLEKWYVENACIPMYFIIILLTIVLVFFPSSKILYKIFKNLPETDNKLI
jgi:lipopolysaccharide/colanic/teichoic acid biosynthesis glycosyltransferase